MALGSSLLARVPTPSYTSHALEDFTTMGNINAGSLHCADCCLPGVAPLIRASHAGGGTPIGPLTAPQLAQWH
jgi:hypothetical protein